MMTTKKGSIKLDQSPCTIGHSTKQHNHLINSQPKCSSPLPLPLSSCVFGDVIPSCPGICLGIYSGWLLFSTRQDEIHTNHKRRGSSITCCTEIIKQQGDNKLCTFNQTSDGFVWESPQRPANPKGNPSPFRFL